MLPNVRSIQRSFDDLGTPLSEVTFVVIDLETTGASPAVSYTHLTLPTICSV